MNYLNEANEYIKRVEIGKSIREANANRELVECYWNVGRLIVEAQGGKDKAKYGNELLKKWAEKLIKEYGKGYDYTNLSRFRQLYLFFQIVGPNPIANSFTFILHAFATKKCPLSCINIKNPNRNIIFIALIKNETNLCLLFYENWIYLYNKFNKKYANGAMNIMLSILSKIPP